jgi:hypothetical protein
LIGGTSRHGALDAERHRAPTKIKNPMAGLSALGALGVEFRPAQAPERCHV